MNEHQQQQHLTRYKAFRELPLLIVVRITKLVVYPRNKGLLQNCIDNDELKQLVILGQLCRNWRDVSQSIIYRNYTYSQSSKEIIVAKRDRLIYDRATDDSQLGYVRNLVFCFKHNMLVTESALSAIENLLPANACFSAVRRIYINFEVGSDTPDSLPEITESDSIRLAACIHKLAPNAHTIIIFVAAAEGGPNFFNGVNRIIWHVLSGIQTQGLTIMQNYHLPLEPRHIPKCLTYLQLEWNKMYDDSTALMHMNANTLQKLIVGGAKDNDFSQLLIDSNGQNVVYPKLLILRMYLKNVVYVALENRPTFESTMVPFPRLERLTIEMVYPFGDDVVFRGNTETLKSIAIRTDEDALEMLINLKTLAQGRFLALRTFKLMSYIDALGSMRDLAKENITLIEGVNRQVENLQLVFSEAGRRLIGRINNGLAFDRLRQLDVCETYMSIRDVLRMLKMLPHLQRLRSKLAAVSMFHTMAQNAQSVDSFCEKNMRSGVWLQQWDIFYGDVSPIARYSSIYAAFLAVICPHFACLKVQHKTSEKHYAGIALLQRTTFSAHAQSLQRLLSL